MFIDTHCHLSCRDYEDIDEVIRENRASGVDKIIISACEKEDFEEALFLAEKYPDIYLTLGYHPDAVLNVGKEDISYLRECLSGKKVVGLGECGLDYHYSKDDRDRQMALFEAQLKVAEELSLPVVIHSRDATEDTINTLKKYKVKGVIHCFSGKVETAKIYIKMGYKLGIGGVVTFTNSNLYKVVEEVGVENIVLETDSPYLAPVPFRGKKNSSKYIPVIAEKVAFTVSKSIQEVGLITSNNACNMFDLK